MGECGRWFVLGLLHPVWRGGPSHHAIMNVCEPEFESRLIHHTYACRRGKGQFAALAAARALPVGTSGF
jgi:hypothetical protein